MSGNSARRSIVAVGYPKFTQIKTSDFFISCPIGPLAPGQCGANRLHSGIPDRHRCAGNLCLLLLEGFSDQGTLIVRPHTFSFPRFTFPDFLFLRTVMTKLRRARKKLFRSDVRFSVSVPFPEAGCWALSALEFQFVMAEVISESYKVWSCEFCFLFDGSSVCY